MLCYLSAVLLLLSGAFVVLAESPSRRCSLKFKDLARSFRSRPWTKAAVYTLLMAPPLLPCLNQWTMIGSLAGLGQASVVAFGEACCCSNKGEEEEGKKKEKGEEGEEEEKEKDGKEVEEKGEDVDDFCDV